MQYYSDEYDVIISVELSNGAYTFVPDSATGKTYLCKTLIDYGRYGEPVHGISYGDPLNGNQVDEKLRNSKIIVIDRYDMYDDTTEIDDIIRKVVEHSVVLIDAKRMIGIKGVSLGCCYVHLSRDEKKEKDKLEVGR